MAQLRVAFFFLVAIFFGLNFLLVFFTGIFRGEFMAYVWMVATAGATWAALEAAFAAMRRPAPKADR